MRISDWSSDVCSSDLELVDDLRADFENRQSAVGGIEQREGPSQQGRGRHLHQVLTVVDFPVKSLSLKIGGQRISGPIEEVPSDIYRFGGRLHGALCMEDERQRGASTVRDVRGSFTFGGKEHFTKLSDGRS